MQHFLYGLPPQERTFTPYSEFLGPEHKDDSFWGDSLDEQALTRSVVYNQQWQD